MRSRVFFLSAKHSPVKKAHAALSKREEKSFVPTKDSSSYCCVDSVAANSSVAGLQLRPADMPRATGNRLAESVVPTVIMTRGTVDSPIAAAALARSKKQYGTVEDPFWLSYLTEDVS